MKTITARHYFTPPNEALRFLPEGPLMLDPKTWPWEGTWIAWVAIQHGEESRIGSINLLNFDTLENRTRELPGRPGFLAETNRPGVLLAGMDHELVVLDLTKTTPETKRLGKRIPFSERTLINDGIATPFGLVFGTKDLRFEDAIGHLHLYVSADQSMHTIRDGQTCSNGKVLLPRTQGWTLLDIDTPTRRIQQYALDVDHRVLTPERTLADFSDVEGLPDGMCLTPDGQHVVVAFYNPNDAPAGEARLVSLDTGKTEMIWRLPGSPRVTCPAFVAHEGHVKLLFATAVEGMPEEQRAKHPQAGAFFIADTDFEGPPVPNPKVDIGAMA